MPEDIPLLANVRIAAPCPANWNEMVGGERVRYCRSCEKNVYNLSEMTRNEAEKLLQTHEGHLCVRYYQRADGTIKTNDCPSEKGDASMYVLHGEALPNRVLIGRVSSPEAFARRKRQRSHP